MKGLRNRVLNAFTLGSVEELAAVLELIALISTQTKNEPTRSSLPAGSRPICKFHPHYPISSSARN
jgi:hypothetical protein